jgi:uncharacterized membrane protein
MAPAILSTNAAGARNGSMSVPRWGALIGGGALALLGLTRRSKSGLVLAAGGGLLAYLATKTSSVPEQLVARSSVLLNCSPQEAFQFWRNFENLPLFMRHLDSVSILGDRRSRWVAAGPLGRGIEWEAEIVAERENELISWRSLDDSEIQVDGFVEFRSATGKRGTVVSANIIYSPPAGRLGNTLAKLLGKDPSFLMKNDLRRFKALMEAGEIPTIEGQPHGPRSMTTGLARLINPDESIRGEVNLGEVFEAKRRLA